MRRKVTVVGAGNVGATCAQVLATRDYAEVVLVDIKENLPQGKALDINQMGAVRSSSSPPESPAQAT
jgi:malate dehydrogenase